MMPRPRSGTEIGVRGVSFTALVMVSALGPACEGDSVSTIDRTPPAANTPDGGQFEPLPFQVGQSFTWNGRLDHRAMAVGDEGNAQFRLSITITAVNDAGESGASSLEVSIDADNSFRDNWDITRDFDSWLARLGPTLDGQSSLDDEADVTTLDGFPDIPMPSELGTETLFIDVRHIETLRSEFNTRYAGRNPRIQTPEDGGSYVFSFEGQEPGLIYYEDGNENRSITLSYHPTGYLVSMSETIGEGGPELTARLSQE